MEHDAERTRREADREQWQHRPDHGQHRGAEADPAEHFIFEQRRHHAAAQALRGPEAGVAGKPDLRLLDHEIAQIYRITERDEADRDHPVERRGRGAEQPALLVRIVVHRVGHRAL